MGEKCFRSFQVTKAYLVHTALGPIAADHIDDALLYASRAKAMGLGGSITRNPSPEYVEIL